MHKINVCNNPFKLIRQKLNKQTTKKFDTKQGIQKMANPNRHKRNENDPNNEIEFHSFGKN